MALRSLIVNLEARTAAFEAALNRADRQIRGFEQTMAKVGRVTAAIATAGGLALAAKKLFDLGAAAEDTRDRFETTFGQSTAAIEAFAKSFGRMAGLSQRNTQDMLAGLGATAQAMGFAEAESARMAETIARLGGDLAEFRGRDTSEVIQSITAALTGATRGLKQYGIVIDEADVQQLALEQSGKKAAAVLTDQEKAAAALTLITERMGKATGELARSQDEAGLRAQQLKAQWQDLIDQFAVRMLPALEAMLPALEALIPPMSKLADLAARFVGGLAQVFDPDLEVKILRRAETASLAGLGDKVLPRAMQRFGGDIASRQAQLTEQRALRAGGHVAADVQIRRLTKEIELYNDLIAEALRRIAAGFSAAADATSGAAPGFDRSHERLLPADLAFRSRQLSPNIGQFGPSGLDLGLGGGTGFGSRGIGSPFGLQHGPPPAVTGNPFQFMIDMMQGPSDHLVAAYQKQVEAMNGAQQGAILMTASIGSAVQALIRGGQQIEQTVISMITTIAQAAVQARIASLSASGQGLGSLPLIGTAIAVGGGILSALFGGGNEPAPVRVEDISDRAARRMVDRGPVEVRLVVTDARGNPISETLVRQERRDGVRRYGNEIVVANG